MTYDGFKQKLDHFNQGIQYGNMDREYTKDYEFARDILIKDYPEYVTQLKKDRDSKRAEQERKIKEADDRTVEFDQRQEQERQRAREARGVKYLDNPFGPP